MGPWYDPAPGIGQFLTGTPQIIGTVAVEEGARLLGEAGIGRLRAKGVALTGYLISLADEWLAEYGFAVASPRADERRGSHVRLQSPGRLADQPGADPAGVIGDYRTPDRLRLGPGADHHPVHRRLGRARHPAPGHGRPGLCGPPRHPRAVT